MLAFVIAPRATDAEIAIVRLNAIICALQVGMAVAVIYAIYSGAGFGTPMTSVLVLGMVALQWVTILLARYGFKRGRDAVRQAGFHICPGCRYRLARSDGPAVCPECGRRYTALSLQETWSRAYRLSGLTPDTGDAR